MDRLSIILSLLSGALLTGAFATVAMSLGYYSWWAIGGSAALGWCLAWPSAYFVSRRIKNNDPEWSPDTDPFEHGPLPRKNTKEV